MRDLIAGVAGFVVLVILLGLPGILTFHGLSAGITYILAIACFLFFMSWIGLYLSRRLA